MLEADEDALLCDLLETYNIYDIKSLPARKVATFALGLGRKSRIARKISGTTYDLETLLLAKIADSAALLVYSKTKDASKNINRPESIVNKLLKPKEKEQINSGQYMVFDTMEDYDNFMKKKRGGTNG